MTASRPPNMQPPTFAERLRCCTCSFTFYCFILMRKYLAHLNSCGNLLWLHPQVMGVVQGVPRPQETSWTALMRDAVASMPATSTPVQAPQLRPAGLPINQPPAWRTSSHPPHAPVPQHSKSCLHTFLPVRRMKRRHKLHWHFKYPWALRLSSYPYLDLYQSAPILRVQPLGS